jgi:hypothetical protein
MEFNTALAQAWNDHAGDAAGVALRLPALLPLVGDEAQLERLVALTHHVHGTHLGQWQEGAAALAPLRTLSVYRDDGPGGQALRRALASLALCEGTAPTGLTPSDQVRVHAMAANNFTDHDMARAAQLFATALDLAERSGLPDSDAMHRTLAVTAHDLACTLETKADRSADERALMILAAQASRHHWERAGTWLEVERAEYRLAMSWLQAGDLAQARGHAQTCLEIVTANDGAALERLFGWEALGRVERAAGNAAGHARALAMVREAFVQLAPDDQAWCATSVEQLAAAA